MQHIQRIDWAQKSSLGNLGDLQTEHSDQTKIIKIMANTFETSRPQMLRWTCAYRQRGDSGSQDTVQSRNLSDRVRPKPEKARRFSSRAAAAKVQSLHNFNTCAEARKNGQRGVVLCDLEIKLYMSYSKYKFRIVLVKMFPHLW